MSTLSVEVTALADVLHLMKLRPNMRGKIAGARDDGNVLGSILQDLGLAASDRVFAEYLTVFVFEVALLVAALPLV